MVRTQAYLTKSQKAQLQHISVVRGVSVAQLIREAVDEFLQDSKSDDAFEQALEGAFGLWKDHEIEDSTAYMRHLRDGWEKRSQRMELNDEVNS